MPLSFESLEHGTLAFGFFNIDTDMLLLEEWFFFADRFCHLLDCVAGHEGSDRFEADIEAFRVSNRLEIGNLMEAIHGVRYTGFVGDVYRKYPFPQSQAGFKQKPEGFENQQVMRELISKYTAPTRLLMAMEPEEGKVSINGYGFDKPMLQELVLYVWRGGYPCWRDGERPDYLLQTKEKIEKSRAPMMQGIVFPP